MSKLSHIKDTTKPIIIYVCVEQILIKKKIRLLVNVHVLKAFMENFAMLYI